MVYAEAKASIAVLKSLYDSAKALKDIHDANVRNAAIADLLDKLVTARTDYAALLEQVDELEAKLRGFETWAAERERYALRPIVPGGFAYVLKKAMAAGEPGHALCTNCYEKGFKSILQSNGTPFINKMALDCPACKASILTGGVEIAEFAD